MSGSPQPSPYGQGASPGYPPGAAPGGPPGVRPPGAPGSQPGAAPAAGPPAPFGAPGSGPPRPHLGAPMMRPPSPASGGSAPGVRPPIGAPPMGGPPGTRPAAVAPGVPGVAQPGTAAAQGGAPGNTGMAPYGSAPPGAAPRPQYGGPPGGPPMMRPPGSGGSVPSAGAPPQGMAGGPPSGSLQRPPGAPMGGGPPGGGIRPPMMRPPVQGGGGVVSGPQGVTSGGRAPGAMTPAGMAGSGSGSGPPPAPFPGAAPPPGGPRPFAQSGMMAPGPPTGPGGPMARPPMMMQQPGPPGAPQPGIVPPQPGMMPGHGTMPGMAPPQPGGVPMQRPMVPGPPGVPGFGARQGGAAGFGAPPGMMAGPPGAPMGGPLGTPSAAMQSLLDNFGELTLAPSVPGQPAEAAMDIGSFPRPAGPSLAPSVAAPPPVHEFNCRPEYLRMTVNAIPNTEALRKRFHLPVGVVVHPMAQIASGGVPIVNMGAAGIVRCKRCRTYVNPFMQWTDGGRSFQCNVCNLLNTVPTEYMAPLDTSGRRVDIMERPELSQGCVEYVAPAEYMVRPPMPPCYYFLIDVTAPAVQSGMVATVAKTIASVLDRLPGGDRTQVGFLTFDSTLQFFNLKSALSSPQMLVVGELEGDGFLPAPDDLLVNLGESRHLVDSLLEALPNMFATTQEVETCTGPALQAAFKVMSHTGGKLLLFQAGVPSLGPGKVKNRDSNSPLYGTDREYTLRVPDDPFWKKFAAEASRQQISADVFSFSAAFTDLASLGALPKYTCGGLHYYPGFNAQRDAPKLTAELSHNLTRETGWEAVCRIRCSKGLKISSFHGHFFIRSTDLLALPAVDPDKAFAVQIAHEETMVTGQVAYVQCALLYTASCGERRIRVSTLMVPVVTEMADLYRSADAGALATLMAKLAVEKSYCSKLDDARQECQTRLTTALREFRLLAGQAAGGRGATHNKLIYPDSLKMLPVLTLGTLKSTALRGTGSTVNADERIAVGHDMMSASVPALMRLVYPQLYAVHDSSGDWGRPSNAEGGDIPLPMTVPDSVAFLDPQGVYLLDNGRVLVLWVSRGASPELLHQLFGLEPGQPEPPALTLEPARPGSELSERVNNLLNRLRRGRPNYQQCFVVRQGSHLEAHVLPYFVEDRSSGTQSYADFLQALHKAVMSKA